MLHNFIIDVFYTWNCIASNESMYCKEITAKPNVMLKSLKRYITQHLFFLLMIPLCSGYNIPTIASGTYGSGWKHDSNGNIKADPSRGVTLQHLEELKTKHNTH